MDKKITISVRTIVRVLFAVCFAASCVANIYFASENASLERVKENYKRSYLVKKHETDSLYDCKNRPSYPAILVTR